MDTLKEHQLLVAANTGDFETVIKIMGALSDTQRESMRPAVVENIFGAVSRYWCLDAPLAKRTVSCLALRR